MHKCPGMNPGFWRPKDVAENKCPSCGGIIEFWKDDIKRKCTECGLYVFNPKLETLCLSWCDRAVECLGNMDIAEWKKQTEGMREPAPPVKSKK